MPPSRKKHKKQETDPDLTDLCKFDEAKSFLSELV